MKLYTFEFDSNYLGGVMVICAANKLAALAILRSELNKPHDWLEYETANERDLSPGVVYYDDGDY